MGVWKTGYADATGKNQKNFPLGWFAGCFNENHCFDRHSSGQELIFRTITCRNNQFIVFTKIACNLFFVKNLNTLRTHE